MTTDCLFCAIAGGDIPTDFVYADKSVVAFNDINPQSPVHVLVIPRQHIATLDDTNDQHEPLLGHLIRVATRIAADRGLAAGYRVVMNCNAEGGQTVFHVHLHLMGGRQLRGLG